MVGAGGGLGGEGEKYELYGGEGESEGGSGSVAGGEQDSGGSGGSAERYGDAADGGDAAGDYNPVTLTPGLHTLTATPFAAMAGGGAAGGSHTVTFRVW